MYTTFIKIPYLTEEIISNIDYISPYLGNIFEIPIIQTEAEAKSHATAKMQERLTGYEFVKEATTAVLDDGRNYWTVSFIISGD